MFTRKRIYQSPLIMVALTAISESQKTIIAMAERFKDSHHVDVFTASLVDMCRKDEYEAALAAIYSMNTDCGIETTAAFDRYIESDYAEHLLYYYVTFIRDIYCEVAENEGNLYSSPDTHDNPGKPILFPDQCLTCYMEALGDDHICILCEALRDLYEDSNKKK